MGLVETHVPLSIPHIFHQSSNPNPIPRPMGSLSPIHYQLPKNGVVTTSLNLFCFVYWQSNSFNHKYKTTQLLLLWCCRVSSNELTHSKKKCRLHGGPWKYHRTQRVWRKRGTELSISSKQCADPSQPSSTSTTSTKSPPSPSSAPPPPPRFARMLTSPTPRSSCFSLSLSLSLHFQIFLDYLLTLLWI